MYGAIEVRDSANDTAEEVLTTSSGDNGHDDVVDHNNGHDRHQHPITTVNHHHLYCNSKTKNNSNDDDDENDEATFFKLVQRNRPFRLYMLSYLITHTGEWLTYIACITAIERLLLESNADDDVQAQQSSRTAIGILVVIRLAPNVLLMTVGGTLADSRDRRVSMIFLDIAGAIVVLLFIVAFDMKSIVGIYLVTFLQQCVAALYEPCRSSIIPLLVPQEDYLKKATTLSSLAWSLMAAVGSSLGGLIVASLGARTCFVLDSLTYLTSAYILWLVGGTWNVATEAEPTSIETAWAQMLTMTVDGATYLYGSFFGTMVFMKASGALVYGASDVLNVSFSEQRQDGHSSERLGALFAIVGIGCLVGPLIADRLTDMSNPSSLQLAVVVALATETLGAFGMAAWASPFWCVCLMTGVRSAGSAVVWIDSSLLLQKFSAPEMLGRVFAVDYSLANLTEAVAALLCGLLQDKAHLSPQYTSFVFACIGSLLVFGWVYYHFCGHGAIQHNNSKSDYKQLVLEQEEESNSEHSTTTPSLIEKPVVRLLLPQ